MNSTKTPTGAPTVQPGPTPFPTSVDARVSSDQLETTVILYAAVGLVCVIVHGFLRTYVRSKYSPRCRHVEEEAVAPEVPRLPWKWFFPLLHPNADEMVLKFAGLDAYVTIRFISLAAKLFGLLAPLGLIFLGTVYATQGSIDNLSSTTKFSEMDRFTMQYVSGGQGAGSRLLWLPCIFVYIFTTIGLWLLHREYLRIVPLQREFLLHTYKATYSAIIERIPKELASRRALRRYFETIYPGSVKKVNLVPMNKTAADLQSALDERRNILQLLENAVMLEHIRNDHHVDDEGSLKDGWTAEAFVFSPSKAWMGMRCLCYGALCHLCGQGRRIHAIPYFQEELQKLNERISEMQTDLRKQIYDERDATYAYSSNDDDAEIGDGHDAWKYTDDKYREAQWLLGDHSTDNESGQFAAFVTFNNKTASLGVTRSMRREGNNLIVSPAPEPVDVNWSRIGCHPGAILLSRILVISLNILLLLGFGFLTSTISLTTNLDNIRQGWSDLDNFLEDNPWAVPIVDQIAPLLLVIAFAVVPPILNLILDLRFELSESSKEKSFFMNYTAFLVFQLFLFFQISGAVVGVFAQSFENPREFVNLLAQMIPSNATFFMQFITIRMFWILPGAELLRVSSLAVAFIVRPLFCSVRSRTPRERRDDTCGCRNLGTPGDAWHGLINAQFMLILCIGVTYSVVAPLVLLFCLVYFAFALLIFRNQLLYVYVKRWETGGSNWTNIGIAYLAAFVILHLTMLGVFALSEAPIQGVLMLPPLVVTLAYMFFLYTLYDTTTSFVSLADARKFDIQFQANPDADPKMAAPDYSHPTLLEPSEARPESLGMMLAELTALQTNGPEADANTWGALLRFDDLLRQTREVDDADRMEQESRREREEEGNVLEPDSDRLVLS